jgi:hypothetical protein
MARKSMGKASKVLGGLGAMYALSKLPVGRGVRLEDADTRSEAQKQRDAEAIAKIPKYNPSAIELEERERENARRLAKLPLITDAEQAQYFSGIDNLVRTESGVPIRTPYGFLQQTNPSMRASRDFVALNPAEFKKGGAVKGWGKARGARKAKVY